MLAQTTKQQPLLSTSLSTVFKLSFPLMLAALSTNLMFFFDRLILSRYALEAMNATASVALILFTFTMAAVAIAGMAEVYVGQYHGAQAYHKMGKPVWQMLWFALGSSITFVPLAFLLKDWVIIDAFKKEGTAYFLWLMSFGGLSAANAAIAAFFVGKGETKWITASVMLGNGVNILLDLVLVFGWHSIPALGATGAAIATVIGQLIQLLFLGAIFLNTENRATYGTAAYQFDATLFKASIRLGIPGALSHSFEIGTWAFLATFLATHNPEYVTIQVIGQTLLGLFGFLTDGLQKGTIALASNIIGAKHPNAIQQAGRNTFKLQYIFAAVLTIPMLLYPDWLIKLLIPTVTTALWFKIKWALIGVWLFYLLDGLNWILVGFITSAGHTTYTMIANLSACWFGVLIPALITVHFYHIPTYMIWMILLPLYAFLHFGLLYYKYKTIDWRKACLID